MRSEYLDQSGLDPGLTDMLQVVQVTHLATLSIEPKNIWHVTNRKGEVMFSAWRERNQRLTNLITISKGAREASENLAVAA